MPGGVVARAFNGTSQTLTATGNATMQIPFPISFGFWLKQSGSPGLFRYYLSKLRVAGQHASWGFGTGNTGELLAYIGYGGATGNFINGNTGLVAAGVFDGNWHHVMATYDGTALRTYLDGVQIGGGISETRAISYSSDVLAIGSFDGTQLWAAGTMAECALWSSALTVDDLRALTAGAAPPAVSGGTLELYWPLHGRHSPEHDWLGSSPLTVTGATTADHPRIFVSAPPWTFDSASAAATNATAECATASGAAGDPVGGVRASAEAAEATGAALGGQGRVSASADVAAVTGTPGDPAGSVGAAVGVATAAGVAEQPAANWSSAVAAEVAAGTGAAAAPSGSVGATTTTATSSGSAETPSGSVGVAPDTATGTGAALQAEGSSSRAVDAGIATATGVAGDLTATGTTTPATATAVGAAETPLAITGSFTIAAAEAATAAGTANTPGGQIRVAAAAAEAATAANGASSAGLFSAGVATAAGAANSPTVDTANTTTVDAEAATATGTAGGPGVDVLAAAEAVLAAAVAADPSLAVTASGTATGAGAALDATVSTNVVPVGPPGILIPALTGTGPVATTASSAGLVASTGGAGPYPTTTVP